MEKLNRSVWDEWVNLPCDPGGLDELSGMLEVLSSKNDAMRTAFISSRLVAMRRLIKLWRENGGGSFEIARDTGKITFIIDSESIPRVALSERGGGRRSWAWLRGVWGARGSLYMPQSGYYMVFRAPAVGTTAPRALSILKAAGIEARHRVVHSSRELMLRNQGDIVTAMAKMGLVRSSLAMEETSIMRSVKNQANKLVNCDSANINKSIGAARRQMILVDELDRRGMIQSLPLPLRELVIARRDNPSASLRELGQELSNPISKSTVEYRWRKLESLMEAEQ